MSEETKHTDSMTTKRILMETKSHWEKLSMRICLNFW